MKTQDAFATDKNDLAEPPEDSSESSWAMLALWMRSKTELAFVYSRSLGGFIQTGRGRITGLDHQYLELRTSDSTTLVVLRNARFGNEPQAFFSPSFTSSRLVPGISIGLENCDWLFFTDEADPLVSHGHVLPGP